MNTLRYVITLVGWGWRRSDERFIKHSITWVIFWSIYWNYSARSLCESHYIAYIMSACGWVDGAEIWFLPIHFIKFTWLIFCVVFLFPLSFSCIRLPYNSYVYFHTFILPFLLVKLIPSMEICLPFHVQGGIDIPLQFVLNDLTRGNCSNIIVIEGICFYFVFSLGPQCR